MTADCNLNNCCFSLVTYNKHPRVIRYKMLFSIQEGLLNSYGVRTSTVPIVGNVNGMIERYISLTHWGRVTHICVGKLTIIDSDNGLSPGRRQAIIWTNAGILLIGSLGTNFNEILIGVQTFSFKKMLLKMSSAKWRPFCLGLNVLKEIIRPMPSLQLMD